MQSSSSRMYPEQNEIKQYWVSHSGRNYSSVLVWRGAHRQIPAVIGTVWNVGGQRCRTRRRTLGNLAITSQATEHAKKLNRTQALCSSTEISPISLKSSWKWCTMRQVMLVCPQIVMCQERACIKTDVETKRL